MAYSSGQIATILLKADKTMYKLGDVAYDDMFYELDEAYDYERDIIFIYKKAVEYGDDYFVGTLKLDQIVERLAAKLNIYDYGILSPIYVDVYTQVDQGLNIIYVLKTTALNLGAGLTGSTDFSQSQVDINIDYVYLNNVYVIDDRTLTINGVTYNLSANRTWSISLDSVTDVSATTTNSITVGSLYLTGMTAGSGALYYTGTRLTLANYNVGGTVFVEVNGGAYAAVFGADLSFTSNGTIGGVFNQAVIDTDRFLVSDGGVIKYRTGAELLSDIGGQPSGNYVQESRTLTINGTTYDLSANRTWSVGTVTSVSALTIGTSGTDLSSTVATGTTTPVITLNVPTASATNRGALSSADWTTFNSKVGGTGVAGQVAYWSGTNTQTGSNNLFWDTANNRLGVGLINPQRALEVYSATPDSHLRLSGSAPSVSMGDSIVGGLYQAKFGLATANGQYASASVAGDFVILSQTGATIFMTSATEKMRITAAGRMLLGTTTEGTFLLDVNGTTRLNGVTTIGTINQATTDTDRFLVSDAGVVKYRTGAELLSDIGAQPSGNYVPESRTLTINGTTYDLSANRTWSVGTVTGTGTTNVLPKWTSSSALGNSIIDDDGTSASVALALGGAFNIKYLSAIKLALTGGTTFGSIDVPVGLDFLIRPDSIEKLKLSSTGLLRLAQYGTGSVTGTPTYRLATDASGNIIEVSDGGGTVTSVGLSMPSAFNVTNSPVTGAGTLTVTGAGTSAQYVRGDGQLANFPSTSGGGSSVNYYLNGSVNQGTFGGDTYYEMSKSPIAGAGTNFTRTSAQGNGYIASFITDANDPSLLVIPGGNWNLEFYFNASSGGGTPSFYAELYKVSSSNVFTLIASGSTNAEGITQGTVVDQYFTSIPVPQTSLLATDRIAVRIFVTPDGRNITLHTEDNNLCEVLTTFSTGLNALNGLTAQVQYFATGTSGTDFAISSATDTHTFNLPIASGTNTGKLSNTDWTTFINKQNAITLTTFNASGSATFVSSVLNIPTYTLVGLGGEPAITPGASTQYFRGDKTFQTLDTSVVPENSNLYYTDTRARNAITLTTTGSSGASTYSGGTLNIPIYSLSGLGGVPTTRTLTINGTAYDLSADRSWTIPVHDAVTIGTANGLSLSTQVLSLGLSSSSANGALSSTDWSTFNGKQNAITLTTTGSSGAATLIGSTLNIPQYSGTPAGSNTQIQYNNSGAFGASANLVWDNTNARLGIGIATPTTKLNVQDTGLLQTLFETTSSSNRVITKIKSPDTYLDFRVHGALSSGDTWFGVNSAQTNVMFTQYGHLLIGTYDNKNLYLGTNNTTRALITVSGRLLLGTTTESTYLLDVNGTARVSSNLTASSFIKSGGTSSQFLKADGSVDSSSYLSLTGGTLSSASSAETLRLINTGTGYGLYNQSDSYFQGDVKFQSVSNTILKVDASNKLIAAVAGTDYQAPITNPVTGTGTTNYLPKWTSGSAIGNSQIFDNGTNVGIGTASPVAKLDVVGGNGDGLQYRTSTRTVGIGQVFNEASIYWGSSTDLIFFTGAERARFTSGGNLLVNSTTDNGNRLQVTGNGYFSGNVGIGVVTPLGKLHVVGNGIFDDGVNGRITIENASGQNDIYSTTTGFASYKDLRYTAAGHIFRNGTTETMRLNASGNLGLGVTPSAWDAGIKAFEIFSSGNAIVSSTSSQNIITTNARYVGGGWQYGSNGLASTYQQQSGVHTWNLAPSGTAGNAITFTQAMTLTANGRLLLGTTTEGTQLLQVNGTGLFTGVVKINTSGGAILDFNRGSDTLITLYQDGTNYGFYNNGRSLSDFVINYTTGAATFSSSVTATSATFANGVSNTQLTVNGVGAIKSGINFANGGTTYGQIYFDNNPPYDMSVLQQYTTGSLIFGTNNTERMRLTSGGNVGIGTTAPAARFSVNLDNFPSDGGTIARFTAGTTTPTTERFVELFQSYTGAAFDSPMLVFRSNTNASNNSSYSVVRGTADGAIVFSNINNTTSGISAATEKMRLTGSGNLLVGTTTDSGEKLQVSGVITSILSSGSVRTSPSDNAGMLHIRPNAGQNGYITFTENAIADRWAIGVTNGDSNFYFRTPYPTSTPVVTIASTGAATFSSSVTATQLDAYTSEGGSKIGATHGTGGTYPKASGISFGATSTSLSVSNNGGTTTFTGGAGIYANNSAASNNPTDLILWTTSGGVPAERMRITSGGNLLVGTTTDPGSKLYLVGSSARLENTSSTFELDIYGNSNILRVASGSTSASIQTLQNNPIIFGTGASERMRITSGGNVGVNCAATNAKLEVVATTGEVFRADAASGAYRIVATQTGVNLQGKLNLANLPTSSSGLSAGDVWNDGGTLKIV